MTGQHKSSKNAIYQLRTALFLVVAVLLFLGKTTVYAASLFDSWVSSTQSAVENSAAGVIQNIGNTIANKVSGGVSGVFGSGSGGGGLSGTTYQSVGSIFQDVPVPGSTVGKTNCQDLQERVQKSSEDALMARMPDKTPNQLLEDNGVFETLKKKITFLGDLLGNLFDFFSGDFSSIMDNAMNLTAEKAFESIGSKLSGSLYNTVVNKANAAIQSGINNATSAIAGDINSTINGAIDNFRAASATDTTGLVKNLANQNQNNLTAMIQSGLPITNYTQGSLENPGTVWFRYQDTGADVAPGVKLACTSQTCLDPTGRVVIPGQPPQSNSGISSGISVW